MKKLLLVLSLAFSINLSKAQLITQGDFPFLGDIWVEYVDTVPSGFSISPAGFGQVWDFSTLFNVNDTAGFLFNPPNAVPNNWDQYFPGAHYSFFTQDTDSVTLFFKNATNGFFLDGIANNNDSLTPNGLNYLDYQPDYLFFPAPFQYGDTVVHFAKWSINDVVSGFPVLLTITFRQEFIGDGSGSLTTPLSNYPAVLRMKNTTTAYDSTFIDFNDGNGFVLSSSNGPNDTTISYSFLKDGPWMLVANLEVDPITQNVSRAGYYESYLINAIADESKNEISVYPNPVNNSESLSIESKESGNLMVFDINGKLVKILLLNRGRNIVSTESLPSGVYHYEFRGISNASPSRGKIVVIKG